MFSDLLLSIAGGSVGGSTIGATINYRNNNHLFLLIYIYQTDMKFETAAISPFVVLPIFFNERQINEFFVLYGRRTAKRDHSLSYSGGISFNHVLLQSGQESNFGDSNVFVGFPFKLNIKWLKKKKRRFRAYFDIIPIGKASSFGKSYGFKL